MTWRRKNNDFLCLLSQIIRIGITYLYRHHKHTMRTFTLFSSLLLSATLAAQTFYNPLTIPPALSGTTFNLNVAPAVHQFFNSVNTPTYGINGTYLGPTLLMNQGDSVAINVTNNLNETTTMHWHGMHVPAWTDGGPHTEIPAGTTWQIGYKVMNPASTNWYHPHTHMSTGNQVYMGLAGMLIVKDTVEAQLNLPRTYGTDDFPLVLQDRSFNSNGTFFIEGLADSMFVNGTPHPYLDCPAQVVRLRLLNGSNVRTYNIGFSDNRSFYVIASDGGLLAQPYLTNRLLITNGERYEILLDLTNSQGNTFNLMSYASQFAGNEPGGSGMMNGNSPLNGVDFGIMQLNVVAPTGNPVTQVPASLITVNPLQAVNANLTRYKSIDGMGMFTNMANFSFNNTPFNMMFINDTIVLNDTEIWQFTNNSNLAHPIHIHDIEFYVLSRNGNAPPAYEGGLKDVFYIKPNDVVRVIAKFEDFADDTVPYMYHCHNLMHEDNGMMAQFIVVSSPNTIGSNAAENVKPVVFPNPAGDFVNLQLPEVISHNIAEIVVTDNLGRLVYSSATTDTQLQLKTTGWSNGLYTVTVRSGAMLWHSKLLVNHR